MKGEWENCKSIVLIMFKCVFILIIINYLHPSPQAIESCVAAAGFSVGEFAALVFSGSMNFTEGKKR